MSGTFPALDERGQKELVGALLQWSLANGLTMYPPEFNAYLVAHAPVTLFPTPMPKQAFELGLQVQKEFNKVYANIVAEKKWLNEVVETLSTYDPEFTGKLFEVYQKSLVDGKSVQPVSLGLFRLDYMLDQVKNEIKQIEFNTVSVLFGGLSTRVGQLHQYLNKLGYYDRDYLYEFYDDIPVSSLDHDLARGLAQANEHYRNVCSPSTTTVVLVIVQPNERNCFDQRHLEYALLSDHGVKLVRMTLEEVMKSTTVRETRLYAKQTMDEISVVYFRAGYGPDEYTTTNHWDARLTLEKNLAIKCPSLLTQLSGAKKIQQELTNEGILKHYVDEKGAVDLAKTFVKIYPLDDSTQGLEAQKLAQDPEQCERFVLKPQREGGGNNIYKKDIPEYLAKLPKDQWQAYILMEIINPATHKNKIIRLGKVYDEEILSELGIFGTILFNEDSGDIYQNDNAGFLLRSKFSSSNEGGVAAGFGCVDNIHLV